MRPFLLALATTTFLLGQGVVQYAPRVDPGLPTYVPGAQVESVLESIGADSLTDVFDEWQDAFRALQPRVKYKVVQTLSTTAVKAFIEQGAPLIHLVREMSQEEMQGFERKYGYPPTKVVVCFDAFIVFVNAANPIREIGMDQLDAIYSTTRNAGYRKDAPMDTWGDVGARGTWAKRPIHAYMRAEGTAARATLRGQLLQNGKYRPEVMDSPDWPGISEKVMTDALGIGISTLSNWFSRNKTLAVTPLQTTEAVAPTQENVVTGKYPLARTYYFYVNRAPGKPLSPEVWEFLQFVLSQQGQTAVTQASLYPLPADLAALYRRRLRSN